MNLREDSRLQLPGEIAVTLARLAGGIAQRMVEVAVSSGIALVSVGTGHLLMDDAEDPADGEPGHAPRYRAAA